MFNFGYTFIWTAINLFVLFLILRKILFKPVTDFMEKRANSIRESLENAEKRQHEADELYKMYEEQLAKAKEQAESIIAEARQRAEREYKRIIEEAHAEADKIINNSVQAIEKERLQMMKEVKNQIASLAISAASKIIEANMDTENNRRIIDKFLEKEGAA